MGVLPFFSHSLRKHYIVFFSGCKGKTREIREKPADLWGWEHPGGGDCGIWKTKSCHRNGKGRGASQSSRPQARNKAMTGRPYRWLMVGRSPSQRKMKSSKSWGLGGLVWGRVWGFPLLMPAPPFCVYGLFYAKAAAKLPEILRWIPKNSKGGA